MPQSLRNIASCVFRSVNLELYKARDVMTSPVWTIHSCETVSALAKLLIETDHEGFPVVKFDESTNTELAYGLITRWVIQCLWISWLTGTIAKSFFNTIQDWAICDIVQHWGLWWNQTRHHSYSRNQLWWGKMSPSWSRFASKLVWHQSNFDASLSCSFSFLWISSETLKLPLSAWDHILALQSIIQYLWTW